MKFYLQLSHTFSKKSVAPNDLSLSLSSLSTACGRGNFGRAIDICKLPRGGNLAPMDNKMVRIVQDTNVYPTNSLEWLALALLDVEACG